jgi:hypothetical protein
MGALHFPLQRCGGIATGGVCCVSFVECANENEMMLILLSRLVPYKDI